MGQNGHGAKEINANGMALFAAMLWAVGEVLRTVDPELKCFMMRLHPAQSAQFKMIVATCGLHQVFESLEAKAKGEDKPLPKGRQFDALNWTFEFLWIGKMKYILDGDCPMGEIRFEWRLDLAQEERQFLPPNLYEPGGLIARIYNLAVPVMQ